MHYKLLIVVFGVLLVLTSNFASAVKSKTISQNEAIIKLRRENDSLKRTLNQITSVQKRFENNLLLEENKQKSLTDLYSSFIKNNNHGTRLSKMGSIILLLGAFFEIIGAILLAGADLSNKMEPIKSIHLRYTAGDLAIQDHLKDNVMTFLGVVGSLSILIGFCLQFIGTIIVLGLIWYWMLIIAGIAILISITLITFLANQTLGQPLKEKVKIFIHNVHTVFIFPIKKKLANNHTVVCEICQKFMQYEEAEIWYKQGDNTESFPYLYPPYGFYIGHSKCLKTVYPDFEDDNHLSDFILKHPIYKRKLGVFSIEYFNDIYNWNQMRIKDLKHKRNSNKEIIDETTATLNYLKVFLPTKVKLVKI
ncbi:hypothetical protein HDF24_23745 [Mucilaginibacter sp. X4EP1]|uniref:hypothetical protein n=1 Tax=Mucilaginibacter sp. X4EP1 TaxID=2723092 RepID=UPI00216A90C2|nr:hypothetical protein [Mucilaginibacter sp. X4EP1]MCS3815948.1 hypothetical protein [Mucilaginibacter sp. X4EP1]